MITVIDKTFDFCYGHRVHNQRLNTKFTENGDACLKCRHIHGHQGKVKVSLRETYPGENIQTTGMVTDFKHLGWFKNFIDDVLDHKMIIDMKDPLFKDMFYLCSKTELSTGWGYVNHETVIEMHEKYFIPDLTYIKKMIDEMNINDKEKDAIFEKYEGAVFVDFVPTSENLTAWLLDVVKNKMSAMDNIRVHSVEFNETPKSHVIVYNKDKI